MDVSKGGLVVISDVSYILSKEFRIDIELRLKHNMYNTIIQSAELASPYVVIHTGGENSVACTRGEISTGYA